MSEEKHPHILLPDKKHFHRKDELYGSPKPKKEPKVKST